MFCGSSAPRSTRPVTPIASSWPTASRWAFVERVLGDGDFVAALGAEIEAARTPPTASIDARDFVHAVLPYVASQFDLQIAEITTNSRRRAGVRARALISYAAVRHAGLPARRIAPLLGVSPRTVLDGVCLAERHFSPDILADPKLRPGR